MGKEKSIDGGSQMYRLHEDGDLLRMSVLVSSSMCNDEVVFALTHAEADAYRLRGTTYLDELAKRVRQSPALYRSR